MVLNGHLYTTFKTTLSFPSALALASTQAYNGLTGHLVTMSDIAELVFVFESPMQDVWLGISDKSREGYWSFVSGPESGLASPPIFWAEGEPGGGTAENCADSSRYIIRDLNCDSNTRNVAIEFECNVPYGAADVSSCPCKCA